MLSEDRRENTEHAVFIANDDWKNAPLHIKAMAGKHVMPILNAINAINAELAQLDIDLIKGER